MKPVVYVETSIFSVLVARPTRDMELATRQFTTRRWWNDDAQAYSLVTSDEVRIEASAGDAEMARQRLEYIVTLPMLSRTKEAATLAAGLIGHRILPPKAGPDAMHLGISTVHGVAALLTWNCRHLANGIILGRAREYLAKNGYTMPEVVTPMQLPRVLHGR